MPGVCELDEHEDRVRRARRPDVDLDPSGASAPIRSASSVARSSLAAPTRRYFQWRLTSMPSSARREANARVSCSVGRSTRTSHW